MYGKCFVRCCCLVLAVSLHHKALHTFYQRNAIFHSLAFTLGYTSYMVYKFRGMITWKVDKSQGMTARIGIDPLHGSISQSLSSCTWLILSVTKKFLVFAELVYRNCRVAGIETVTSDTKLFSIELPDRVYYRTPIGHHVLLQGDVQGEKTLFHSLILE